MTRLTLWMTLAYCLATIHAQDGLLDGLDGPSCPEIPTNNVDFGAAVGPFPKDIPKGCSDFEVLVARGTSEPNAAPNGKFGVVVGDPLISNLTKTIPGARGYPVQYPASTSVITGGLMAIRDINERIEAQSQACPEQKFALVGYSQGASVMARAMEKLDSKLFPKILALAMFGDPNLRGGLDGTDYPPELEQKLLESCDARDPTCSSEGDCTFYHLTYIRPFWIDRAVEFIAAAFKGEPMAGNLETLEPPQQ